MRDRSLTALQRFITDALRRDVATGDGPAFSSEVTDFLVPGPRGLDAGARLEIYREQFWLRHHSNLCDDFPTLRWCVGAAGFREIVSGYLGSHPPRTWNLQRLGADLPMYLSARAPWRDDALALDAVRLDWAFMEAFDAPDAGPLDLRVLTGAPEEAWPGARIALHPSIRRLGLTYPVHELRDAVKRGEARERPAAAEARVIVWRDAACLLRVASIEPQAFDLLSELARGTPLGPACEAVARAHGSADTQELGARVGEWFQRWTASGWVSAVHLEA